MQLCFATSTNRKGKHDGDYFVSEMRAYREYYSNQMIETFEVPATITPAKRRVLIVNRIAQCTQPIHALVFFMHGTSKSLLGAGLNIWNGYKLIDALRGTESLSIVLYSCSNGAPTDPRFDHCYFESDIEMRGEYGFAMRLAWFCRERGIHARIYSHDRSGDTTRNPHVKMISNSDTSISRLGPVNPGDDLWKVWRERLRDHPNFRFRAPFLSIDRIEAELKGEAKWTDCGKAQAKFTDR
jgi:hypothetical protein